MKKLLLIALVAIASVCLAQSSGGNRSSGGAVIGPSGAQGWNITDMSTFGVKGDTKWIGDGSISSGSAVMTCPNSDCAFSSADVGKVCFATQSGSGNQTILPTGTISSVTDASHATCSGGNATGTNTSTAILVWGTDDDAALNTADAATFGKCLGLKIHGNILIKTGKFRTIASTYPGCDTTNTYGATGGVNHALVEGNGQINTYLIPSPNFDFTTCTGTGVSGLGSCIGPGGTTLAEFKNFTVDGFYGGNSSRANALISDSYIIYDFVLGYWCQNCSSTVGMAFTNQAANGMLGGVINAGLIDCYVAGQQVFMGPNWACEGSNANFGLQVAASGTAKSINTYFSGPTNSVQVLAGGQWMSDFDEVGGGTFGPISNAGTMFLNRFNGQNVKTSFMPMVLAATSKNYIANTNLAPTSGNWATIATGAQVFDQGGNTYAGGVGGTCGAACLLGSYSQNSAVCVAGNFGFTSGWGTTAVTGTPSGDGNFCQFSIQTTVTGSASPVLTYTFPVSWTGYGRTPACTMNQVGGTFTLSNPAHVTTTTTDTITFVGTPTATQTYTFIEECR